MKYQKLLNFLQNVGKDPSVLIFEDELTGLNNRRFLLNYLKTGVNWENTDKTPFSIVMMDIDYFKRINDLYGHDIGDQALVHVAEILKKISAGNGIPIRFAGDEFLILLPGKNKAEALSIGARLVQIVQENPFSPGAGTTAIEITVSVGVATAPDDAVNGKILITQADTAMYSAKHSGRNIYADAGAVNRNVVFPRIAVHYLEDAGITGRKAQLEAISRSLRKVGEGESRFVIVDGASGMGKTSLLDTIWRNLEKTSLSPIRIAGVVQEACRPYYLMSYLALALMNQCEDKGLSVLSSMDEKEVGHLAGILPQLSGSDIILGKSGPEDRKALFAVFVKFLVKLVGSRPLVLLIDDLHFADPASLHLLRFIFREQAILLFVCATAAMEDASGAGTLPLELFRTAYSQEMEIETVPLTPLSAPDISSHLDAIFPGISIPRGLMDQIIRVTEGNPFFMVQLMRKMVEDGNIVETGNKWSIKRVRRSYFPASIDEIIYQRVASLDDDSRRFLNRASAFGESTSLSMLVGSGSEQPGEAHDFLNHVVDKGIVRSDFEQNDENVRFSSKQVRDVVYDNIGPEDKKRLHNVIGEYQEKLYQQDVLHSPAYLAYHFKRSHNKGKADNYEQLQDAWNKDIFNEREIFHYTGEDAADKDELEEEEGLGDEIADSPVSEDSMKRIPGMLRALLIAIRNTMLYPASSKSVQDAMSQFMRRLEPILVSEDRFSIIVEKKDILVNGANVDVVEIQSISEKIISLWRGLELKSLTFIKGTTEKEVKALLNRISTVERKAIAPGFWKCFAEENKLVTLIPRQVRYRKIRSDEESSASALPVDIPLDRTENAEDATIDKTELIRIQRVITSLLGAVSKLKLYPATGPVAKKAISHVLTELRGIFEARPALSIARVDDALLFDGIKVDMSGFETLGNGLLKFLAAAHINSLTFVKNLTLEELVDFLSAFSNRPDGEMAPTFWRDTAREKQIKNILFDYGVYGDIGAVPGASGPVGAKPVSGDHEKTDNSDRAEKVDEQQATAGPSPAGPGPELAMEGQPLEMAASGPEDSQEAGSLEKRVRDLFLQEDKKGAQALVEGLLNDYKRADAREKAGVLEHFSGLLNPEEWKPGAEYLRLVTDPLVRLLEAEPDDVLAKRAAAMLTEVAEKFILFSDYRSATRILAGVKAKAGHDQVFESGELSQKAAEAVMEDFRAGDTEKQQAAYQLASSLGPAALPMLGDMIRRVDRLRVRQLAAELIAALGADGEKFIKFTLMGESRPDYRARILDVVDAVTTDLLTELTFSFSDTSDIVCRSAYRLAERIATPEIVGILMEFAKGEDEKTAVFAISSLGKIGDRSAIDTLIHVLEESLSADVQMAACRAMDRMSDPAFLAPLVRLLLPKRKKLFGKKYEPPVRVAAAYAISKIPDSRADTILQGLANDSDPRVRESARQILAARG
ncbi:MAG: diguanylate cyclase [Deltaproteobacteria bacterium]|nr:diguanylate cyclase [Deltaproteobacteria bacterium]